MRRTLATLVLAVLASAGCKVVDEHRNHAPTLEPVSVSTKEDYWKKFTMVATDEDGDDISISLGLSAYVQLTRVSETRVDEGTRLEAEAYLWARPDDNGPYSFTVYLSDGMDDASFEIDAPIEPVDDEPVAVSDRIAGTTNAPSVIDAATLLANDFDLDDTEDARDELSIVGVDAPVAGTVMLAAGSIVFTPEAEFVGTGSFRYTVSDGEMTARATVYIDVGGANAAPSPAADGVSTLEGAPFQIPVSLLVGNDVDLDGHTLTLIGVSNATHGQVSLDHTMITFDPDDLWYGTAGFDYTVSDGVATAIGHVSVEVYGYL